MPSQIGRRTTTAPSSRRWGRALLRSAAFCLNRGEKKRGDDLTSRSSERRSRHRAGNSAAIAIAAVAAIRGGRVAVGGIAIAAIAAVVAVAAVIGASGDCAADDGASCDAVARRDNPDRDNPSRDSRGIPGRRDSPIRRRGIRRRDSRYHAAAPTHLGRVLVDHRFYRRHICRHRPACAPALSRTAVAARTAVRSGLLNTLMTISVLFGSAWRGPVTAIPGWRCRGRFDLDQAVVRPRETVPSRCAAP